MGSASDFNHFEDILPDQAIPNFGIRIVCYYDTEGSFHYKMDIDQDGPASLTNLIGVLEMSKMDLISLSHQISNGRKHNNGNQEDN